MANPNTPFMVEDSEIPNPSSDNTHDIDNPLPDHVVDIGQVERDIISGDVDIQSIEALTQFAYLYSEHGTDPALNDYGVRMGYLTSAAHIACESFESLSTEAITTAQENLLTTLKDKIGQWLTKVGPTLNNTRKAITAFISRQLAKIGEMLASAAGRIKSTVRAHPLATVTAAVAACVGLGAVVPAMMRTIPSIMGTVGRAGGAALKAEGAAAATSGAEASSVVGKLQGLLSRIKWPFGSPTIEATGKRSFRLFFKNKKSLSVEGAAKSSKLLGWTDAAMNGIRASLAQVKQFAPNLTNMAEKHFVGEINGIKELWRNKSYLRLVGSIGWKAMIYVPFLELGWSVIKAAFGLVKEIIWGTFRLVTHTFGALIGHKVDPTETPNATPEQEQETSDTNTTKDQNTSDQKAATGL